ncbi:MAG: hypothetical protein JST12_17190 [Armatimonadetes bacterium]|nr:hypothetical protein [Armatimonadota bacterium]
MDIPDDLRPRWMPKWLIAFMFGPKFKRFMKWVMLFVAVVAVTKTIYNCVAPGHDRVIRLVLLGPVLFVLAQTALLIWKIEKGKFESPSKLWIFAALAVFLPETTRKEGFLAASTDFAIILGIFWVFNLFDRRKQKDICS